MTTQQSQWITNRIEAGIAGAVHYVGGPCQKGHDGLRYVQSRQCVACKSLRNRRLEATAKRDSMAPYKPANKIPGNRWPGSPEDFTDDRRACKREPMWRESMMARPARRAA